MNRATSAFVFPPPSPTTLQNRSTFSISHPKLRYHTIRHDITPAHIPKACTTAPTTSPRQDRHAPENLGFLHVATITTAHGVTGEVKATSTTDFPTHRLSPSPDLARFLLLPGRRYPRPVTIQSSRRASREGVWILRLSDVRSRDDIQTMRLKGARLYVRQADRPPLARGEYVVADLIDLRVALRNDSATAYVAHTARRGTIAADPPIGIVEGIVTRQELCKSSRAGDAAAAVANDLLEIALFEHPDLEQPQSFSHEVPDDATRVLVPFVKQIVPIVDLSVALVVLDPPPGLLSIAVVNQSERPRPPRGLLMPAKP